VNDRNQSQFGKIKRESEIEAANCRWRDQVELAALVDSQLAEEPVE
jgi:hypothetical protein